MGDDIESALGKIFPGAEVWIHDDLVVVKYRYQDRQATLCVRVAFDVSSVMDFSGMEIITDFYPEGENCLGLAGRTWSGDCYLKFFGCRFKEVGK
ncbi:MAG: hypothetical protein PHQ18_05315 [Patescibacteria group bacterium]|nr:hypothetical protein [Patescibacteria group bacterium]